MSKTLRRIIGATFMLACAGLMVTASVRDASARDPLYRLTGGSHCISECYSYSDICNCMKLPPIIVPIG